MRRLTGNFRTLALVVLLAPLFTGCLAERSLSMDFARSWKAPAILIMVPDVLLKENLKTGEVDKRKDLSPLERDSILFFGSEYIQRVSDSAFLEIHVNALVEELRSQGYVVFWEYALDTFLAWQGEAYILDMAQILLEEFAIPQVEQEIFDDTLTYYKRFNLNAISINTWFELSQVNAEEPLRDLLYASHYLQDRLKGNFVRHPLKGSVTYKYTHIQLDVSDIYRLAGILGKKYAGWITDHLMHAYVRSNMPENIRPEAWYHFDPV
ncbi:MAG: hypothetical protein IH599_00945, partial [Bacteroidales bacterium]|nr:hypothetical protein [Bacteroidales bacterium]